MKRQEAIDFMKTSIDIQDWNQKREVIKADAECGGQSLINTIIDQNGMCPKTLKKNKKKVVVG